MVDDFRQAQMMKLNALAQHMVDMIALAHHELDEEGRARLANAAFCLENATLWFEKAMRGKS